MGLFDKKNCDICGEQIGLLGNRKVADGNICKNCAKKLSPFYSSRRRAELAEIREHLDYRAANQGRVNNFSASRVIGESYPKFHLNERDNTFCLATKDPQKENADVFSTDQVTSARLEIKENKKTDEKERTYIEYFFYIHLTLNVPWADDEIEVRMNNFGAKKGDKYYWLQRECNEVLNFLHRRGPAAFNQPQAAPYGAPAGQPYAHPGQPYQQGGMGYGGAGQPYQQPGQPYPQQGQPYPQAGQPYPQQGGFAPAQGLTGIQQAPTVPGNFVCAACGYEQAADAGEVVKFCPACGTPQPLNGEERSES